MAVLTISRQFGAGGKTLAKRVSQQLGFPIADEEIIEKLAESGKTSAEQIRAFEVEEDYQSRLQSKTAARQFIERIFDTQRKYMDGQRYVRLLSQIIPEICKQGDWIILGRGAQFILKDHPGAVHILLVAEEIDRIQFMQTRYGLAPDDALQAVVRQGRRRLKLMKLFHHDDYDHPLHYKMVINMSKTGLDRAVELVCALVQAEIGRTDKLSPGGD